MRKPCVFKSSWSATSPRIYWMERKDDEDDDRDEVPKAVVFFERESAEPFKTVPLTELEVMPRVV